MSRGIHNLCIRAVTFSALIVASLSDSQAISFTSFDARSMAMGGAGVAFAGPELAPIFNPALLATSEQGDDAPIRLNLSIAGRLIDRDGFIDGVRHYQDGNADERFRVAVTEFNEILEQSTVTTADFDRLGAASEALFDDIEGLSRKPLRLGASFAATLTRPGPVGIGGFLRAYALGGGEIDFAETDRALVDSIIKFGRDTVRLQELFDPYRKFIRQNADVLQAAFDRAGFPALEMQLRDLLGNSPLAADTDALVSLLERYHDAYVSGGFTVEGPQDLVRLPDFGDSFSTALELQGARIFETGVSIASQADRPGQLSIGGTLKYVEFQTIDYRALLAEATSQNFLFGEHRAIASDLNLDFGITGRFSEQLRWGLVLRNLIARDFETVRGNVIELRPQARVGVAWETQDFTWAADLDLTRNEPLGFDPDKRFLALGFERRWPRWSVRAGLRHNIVDNTNVYGAGVAAQRGRATFEVSAAGAQDTLAVSFQLSVRM